MVRKLVTPVVLVGLAAASAAHAQFRYDTRDKPTARDDVWSWPKAAHDAGIGGTAFGVCEINHSGRLHDCQVLDETPPGHGFGQALLSLTPKYRLRVLNSTDCDDYYHLFPISWRWGNAKVKRPELRRPTPKMDLHEYYPPEALKTNLQGAAVVACDVPATGGAGACRAIYESPAGSGFGAAAVSMSAKFVFEPGTVDGVPTPATAIIPLNFLPTWTSQMVCY